MSLIRAAEVSRSLVPNGVLGITSWKTVGWVKMLARACSAADPSAAAWIRIQDFPGGGYHLIPSRDPVRDHLNLVQGCTDVSRRDHRASYGRRDHRRSARAWSSVLS